MGGVINSPELISASCFINGSDEPKDTTKKRNEKRRNTDALCRNSSCNRLQFHYFHVQLLGLLFEPNDPLRPVSCFVSLHTLIHIIRPVLDHAIDQPRQVMGHGYNRLGGTELGLEPPIFGTEPTITVCQSVGA